MYVGNVARGNPYEPMGGLKKLVKKATKAVAAPVKAVVKTVVEPVKATVAAIQTGSVKPLVESVKVNLPAVITSGIAPVAAQSDGGIMETLQKAVKIGLAPLKDEAARVTHPVRSLKRDTKRVKDSFKSGNFSDPFAAIASVASPGLRPIDSQLRKAGVKGGTARPADLANKKLANALGTKGKGWAGNKPATIVGALITGGAFAAGAGGAGGAGAGAGGAGGGGTAAAGGGAGGTGVFTEAVNAGKKGKKVFDAGKKIAEAVDSGSVSPVSLTPGQGGPSPTSLPDSPPADDKKDNTLLYAGIGGAALLVLLLANHRRA